MPFTRLSMIGYKGAIVLPEEYRQRYCWLVGDLFQIYDKGGVILARPWPRSEKQLCIRCNRPVQKVFFDTINICESCEQKIDLE